MFVFLYVLQLSLYIQKQCDLITVTFLAALRRFISRGGNPCEMYSDNGRNFVGAKNKIKNILKCRNKEEIENYTANEGIKWHFNPPSTFWWIMKSFHTIS